MSRRFINFALFFCIASLACGLSACKGRTLDNVEPTGDTIEVVIMQDTPSESQTQTLNE
ncbi:MAG: hypothetical protein J1D77_02350 [Muribaculaceae bacterium]|nr:hypothetical protein [Muribaculaceae bacterium]